MVRKRRTAAPGTSESTGGDGGGSQYTPDQQPQQGGAFPQAGPQRPPSQQPQQGRGFSQAGPQRPPGQQPQQGGGFLQVGPQPPPGLQPQQGGGLTQGGAQRLPGQQPQQGGVLTQAGPQRPPGQQPQQGGVLTHAGPQRPPGQQPQQSGGFPQSGPQRPPGQQLQQGRGFPQGGAQRPPGQQPKQGRGFLQGGAQRPPAQQPQQGKGYPQGGPQPPPGQKLQQGGGYQQGGGRGYGPHSQQAVGHGGYAGRGGGGPQQGGMPPQQHYGAPQGRGSQPRGGVPQQQPQGGFVGGPSRPPYGPDLHQAANLPPHHGGVLAQSAQPTQSAPYAASSSLAVPQPNPLQVNQQFEQLSVQDEGSSSKATQPVPVSSKALRFPRRPGVGHSGSKCMVKANHFLAQLPDKDVHHYDVTITPEVTSRGVNRAVISQLVTLYRVTYLANRLPAYDGRKSLYTAGPLPFISKQFNITLVDEDDGSGAARREREFKVVIKFAAQIDLHHLQMFLQGRQADAPHEALQVLDIVLRELPTKHYCPVGRSFYSPRLGRRQPLGDGLETWRGFYQSIRPTQMGLSLNIDMSSTAFIEPLPVIEFVCHLLKKDVYAGGLTDAERSKAKKALRGLKVEVTHRGPMRRKYRIHGITNALTRDLSFPIDDRDTPKTVVDYFKETYGCTLQSTLLPCLLVGNQQRPNFMPMEVCKIVEGQRYSKRLNENQITALLRATCQRPKEREQDIAQTVRRNAYGQDEYAQEFGINISDQLALVEARVLPAPWLKYNAGGREKDCLPQVGQWNMMNKKMVNGGTVNNWICINFSSHINVSAAGAFCSELAQMCNTSGMVFRSEPVLPPLSARREQVEGALKSRIHEAMTKLKSKGLDLLVVILPDKNGPMYGEIKRICETDIGVVSQCCLTKHVIKNNKQQYLANVALKINVKVGGRNTVLADAVNRRIPIVASNTDEATIIFGADVTHPHPGEDSSPSIAAVVASQDWPEITKYAGLVCAQEHRQELIQDLYKEWQDPVKGKMTGGMAKELLVSFYVATNRKPSRIIFYRDGVSEGQFSQVLLHEVDAIRKACHSLQQDYQPRITFIVVQKRHHTRLFANNHNDRGATDRSGNILPGTVVDSRICHPTEFDFYLCSHAGIQGTSRPAHYHVLWDENNFSADGLQTLTNNLCYTYARCTRSVSIAPPAYYAHLAAFRARFYLEPTPSDDASTVGAAAGRGGGRGTRVDPGGGNTPPAVKPLPALRDNVKRVMFYC